MHHYLYLSTAINNQEVKGIKPPCNNRPQNIKCMFANGCFKIYLHISSSMVYNQLSRQSQPTIYINIYLSVTTQNPFMRFVKLSLPSGHLRNNFSHILLSFSWYLFSSKILMRVRIHSECYIGYLHIEVL